MASCGCVCPGRGAAVDKAVAQLGGSPAVNAAKHWISVREQTHPAFSASVLWRLALPIDGAVAPGWTALRAIEWGGGLRWYAGEAGDAVRGAAARLGGHAVLYRAPESLRCLEGGLHPAVASPAGACTGA